MESRLSRAITLVSRAHEEALILKIVNERPAPETEVSKRLRLGSALFQYFCVAHRERSTDRSPVTIHQGAWAYCPHGYGCGHDWVGIEPVSDVELLRFGPRFLTPRPAPEVFVDGGWTAA